MTLLLQTRLHLQLQIYGIQNALFVKLQYNMQINRN